MSSTTVSNAAPRSLPAIRTADQGLATVDRKNLCLHLTMLSMYGLLIFAVDSSIASLEAFKAGFRLLAIMALVFVNLICVSRNSLTKSVRGFLIWFLFVALAVVSISWSALPDYAFRQSIWLITMVMFAFTISRLCSIRRHVEVVFMHLATILFLRALFMVIAIWRFGNEAIARSEFQFWHATDAADTAGLGMLAVTGWMILSRRSTAKLAWLPMLLTFAMVCLYAKNRFSMALNPAFLGLLMLMTGSRKILFWFAFALVLIVPVGLVSMDSYNTGSVQKLAERQDTTKNFWSFSGRDEMWSIILENYQSAKILGHGFMTTSAEGEFKVWYNVANWDAHNSILHILVTLGAVGLAIYLLTAFLIPSFLLFKGWLRGLAVPEGGFAHAEDKQLRDDYWDITTVCGIIFGWLYAWSLLNVAFAGYINSSQVVFFAMYGVIIGVLSGRPSLSNPPSSPGKNRS